MEFLFLALEASHVSRPGVSAVPLISPPSQISSYFCNAGHCEDARDARCRTEPDFNQCPAESLDSPPDPSPEENLGFRAKHQRSRRPQRSVPLAEETVPPEGEEEEEEDYDYYGYDSTESPPEEEVEEEEEEEDEPQESSLVYRAGTLHGCCSSQRVCAEMNPMCGTCAPDTYEWQGQCVSCEGTNKGLVALFVFVSLAYVLFFHRVSQSTKGYTKIFL